MATRSSETRAESVACELLEVRGWKSAHPPKGNLLWKNEYRDYPHLLEPLTGKGKKNRGGDAYPDFILVDANIQPLIVGETKARDTDVDTAIHEASDLYGEALIDGGMNVLAAGIAGNDKSNIAVMVSKRAARSWKPIAYRGNPIQWLPTPDEAAQLLQDNRLFDLAPRVPSPQILAKRADEMNRILRECSIQDALRPAAIGAIMLALWESKGNIRMDAHHILSDINRACRDAFVRSGKSDLAESILVNEANGKLAGMAPRLCHILRLLNITTLTAEHDYLGQLYEAFFRFIGGNTIGQFFTPRHVTKYVTDLCEVGREDVVVDPTCGTGGFLIAALYRMMGSRSLTKNQINKLVSDRLLGFDSEPVTAALCVVNMILRGDGTTSVVRGDCFTHPDYPVNSASVVLGNPPFPHRKTDDQPEKFVDRGLEALRTRGKLAMIVPMKMLNDQGKAKWRKATLEKHSLRAVITLPSELFQPYASSTTAIIVIEKGVPHDPKKPTFLCQIENDGFKLRKKVRVPRDGDQLPDAMSAYQTGDSVPRFCIWDSLSVSKEEWSPGAYIESRPADPAEFQETVAWLLRELVAFHASHADRIAALQTDVATGVKTSVPFRDVVGGKPTYLGRRENDVGTLFDIDYGQQELETKRGLKSGNVPVISSAGSDNGCFGFHDFSDRAKIIQPPFVTVPRTGSIGEAFVQIVPCGATSDCLVLVPREGVPIEDLFITAAAIRRERWRFNYGRKMTPKRIARIEIPATQALRDWVSRQLSQTKQVIRSTLRALGGNDIEPRFNELAKQWKMARGPQSSVRRLAMDPAYQRIIGMGDIVVPLILRELEAHPDHWFWALNAITGADPVPEAERGILKAMTQAWIRWGKEHGYY